MRSGLALGALLVVALVLLLHEGRGALFWLDDWQWVLDRRGWSAATFLRPHNEHLSLVPVAIYKLLFVTAGITHALPYRLVVTAGHLGLVTLVYLYARRRIGPVGALIPAVLLLFLGAGWQNILWPFQIGWLASLLAGVGALLALDRDDRAGDIAACVLTAVALASSGVGIAIAAGVVVDLAVGRRRWGAAWIAAVPIAIYAVWWLVYHPANLIAHNVVLVPRFAGEAFGGVLAALAGLTQDLPTGVGESLSYGRPLAVVAAVVLAWWLIRQWPVGGRVWALIAIPVVFWVLTGIRRAGFSSADESRYAYVGVVWVLLLGAELARGVRLPRAAIPWVCAALVVVTVVNVGNLRAGGRFLRDQYALARADLAALDVARGHLAPGYVAGQFPGYPFLQLHAGTWFAAARDLGSPALPAAALETAAPDQRQTADLELARADGAVLKPGDVATTAADAPIVDATTGGTARSGAQGCVTFTPLGGAPPGTPSWLDLTVPPGGLALQAGPAPATVTLRRFSDTFSAPPLGTVAPGGKATLRIGPDRASAVWHVRIETAAKLAACPA